MRLRMVSTASCGAFGGMKKVRNIAVCASVTTRMTS